MKKHGALDLRQSQISQNEIRSSTSSMTPFIYNQQFLREGLARMVASMGLSLTFGEDPRFVHFMHKYAQPVYHRIPRTTSHNDVIKCYLNEKQLVIEEFKNHSGIVYVTSDLWTNQSNEPFTYVTSHYTNSNMKLQKKILGFHKILHPRDGPSIYDSLTSVFREYGIQSKIFSINFDNASNN